MKLYKNMQNIVSESFQKKKIGNEKYSGITYDHKKHPR